MAPTTTHEFAAALRDPSSRAQLGLSSVDQPTAERVINDPATLNEWHRSWLAQSGLTQPPQSAPAEQYAPTPPQPMPTATSTHAAATWPTPAAEPARAPQPAAVGYGSAQSWGGAPAPQATQQAPYVPQQAAAPAAQQPFGWTPGLQAAPVAPAAPMTQQWQPGAQPSGKTWKGITGLILGIVGLALGWFIPLIGFGGIPALVFAVRERAALPVGAPGRGLATAAMVVSIIAIAISGIAFVGYAVSAAQYRSSYGA